MTPAVIPPPSSKNSGGSQNPKAGTVQNANEIDLDDDDDDVVKIGGPTTWHGGDVTSSAEQHEADDADAVQSDDGDQGPAGEFLVVSHELPERPGLLVHPAKSRRANAEGAKAWWEGYYDPQSNENPWDKLEGKMGIGAKGSWLPRGHGYPPGQQPRKPT